MFHRRNYWRGVQTRYGVNLPARTDALQLAEKERREGKEKVYNERMDMIMEVRTPFELSSSQTSSTHVLWNMIMPFEHYHNNEVGCRV